MKYTDKQIEDLIEDIYKGRVTQTELPEDLYYAIADHLEKALYKGFGGDLTNFGGKDYELLNELRENVYMFSGAKTYQQVREMSDFLADSENFKEFKEKALGVYDTYNKNWLEAEYNTAIGQGMQAQQWNEIEKDKKDFPYLRYSAVIDSRTSEICEPINGVTLPVDDPFWSEYTPLNHFNCRCTLEQIDKFEDVQITPKEDIDSLIKGTDENKGLRDTVADVFKMNSGKDGYVFSPEHPYFEVAPKDRDLARENFNLPIPEPPVPKEIEFTPAKNMDEAVKRIKELGVQYFNPKGFGLEHANASLKALEVVPKKAIPDALGSGSYFKDATKVKIERKASEWYGISHTAQDLYIDGKMVFSSDIGMTEEYKKIANIAENRINKGDFKIVGINTSEFKTLADITNKKEVFNELYFKQIGNDYSFNRKGELTHFHEFGHVYDNNSSRLSSRKEWGEIAEKWHNETKIAILKSNSEAFAEAFADYFGNGGKRLPKYVKEFFELNIK